MQALEVNAPIGHGSAVAYASVLWHRRKWLGILVFAAVFSAAAGLVAGLPDLYRATALVLVEQAQISESFAKSSVSSEIEPRLQAVTQEILSRARLQELIDRFDLYPRLRQQAPPEAVIERMRRDIQLVRKEVNQQWGRGLTVAFTLSYQGWDPQTVAEVTNTLASFYVQENEKIRERQAVGTTALLKQQLDDIQQQLRAEQQRADRQRAEQRRARQQRSRAAGSTGDTLVDRLERSKRELAEMRTRLSDKHPDVVQLEREIAALEQQLETADAGAGAPSARPADRAGLARPVAGAERRARAPLPAAAEAPADDQSEPSAGRDHIAVLELYASLLKRYEEARLAETVERQKQNQFRIVDPAIAPAAPAAPPRVRLLLFGLIVALMLAAAAMLLAERLDTSFHSMAELHAFAHLPILAGIPQIASRADAWRRWLGFGATTVLSGIALVLIAQGCYHVAHRAEQLVWVLAQRGT
ncbi:MAG: GNVR domain-containing protein [Sulfurifustis sp.]